MKRKLLLVLGLVFVMITTLVCAVGCKKAEAHKHTWATEWSVGGETHWHACTGEGCTAKKDEGNHEGGTANCTDKKVCTVCGNAYGEVDSSVHKSNEFVYVSNGDGTHTKKYKCCNAVAAEPENCSGGTATVCGEKSVCEVCHAEYGEELAHDWDTEWTTSETKHWHKCKRTGCEAKKDEADHTVGTAATCTAKAVCAACNAEYGEKDPDNHDLEEHAAKAPTCTEIGWDAYVTCKRGGCTYTTYQEKAALGHDWDTEWTTSETQHWHKCKRTGCNAKNAESDHTVGTAATCTAKAVCAACNVEYGEKNAENHTETTYRYETNGAGTHKKIHTCCGAAENAAENCSIDRWEVEDESDTALCVCGHEVSVFNKVVTAGRQDLVVTTYTDIDLDTKAANGWYTYTENYNTTASIVLTGISDYANVVNIKYGDTILGTAITGFDLSSLTDLTKHGEQNLTVIVKDEYDAEHTIVVPVLFVTREIATVTDLMLFVNRKNYTLDGKNPNISGYYRLVNDLVGSTLRDFTASNGNYRNMIFDGNGKTLKLGHWFHYAPGNGLFNIMDRCTVKNLTIDTDYMNKGTPHVVLANDIYGCTFEDITINYIDSVDGGTNAADKGRDFATDECKKDRGFLFSSNVNASTFRNFTINANGKKLGVVIGRMNAWGDGSIKNFIFENFKITNCGGLGAFGWKGKTGEKYMPNDVAGVTVETSTAA